LFDFADFDGHTFVASGAHTAKFLSYLTKGDFNGESRTLSLTNSIVEKVFKGLLRL